MQHAPFTAVKRTRLSEDQIRFYLPAHLKRHLQQIADERGVTLSAFMRLIATEYIKLKR